jgi:hypothetical protein
MRKKYRIKTSDEYVAGMGGHLTTPVYIVQVRSWWSVWVNIKEFVDVWDPDFARREAEELLDKLNEK